QPLTSVVASSLAASWNVRRWHTLQRARSSFANHLKFRKLCVLTPVPTERLPPAALCRKGRRCGKYPHVPLGLARFHAVRLFAANLRTAPECLRKLTGLRRCIDSNPSFGRTHRNDPKQALEGKSTWLVDSPATHE